MRNEVGIRERDKELSGQWREPWPRTPPMPLLTLVEVRLTRLINRRQSVSCSASSGGLSLQCRNISIPNVICSAHVPIIDCPGRDRTHAGFNLDRCRSTSSLINPDPAAIQTSTSFPAGSSSSSLAMPPSPQSRSSLRARAGCGLRSPSFLAMNARIRREPS